MKIINEIKAVGLKDWLWFVFVIKRNEFHKSLDNLKKGTFEKRIRAHNIDEKLECIK